VLTIYEGDILGQSVSLVLLIVSLPHLHVISAAKLYVSKFELNL
jgi:hypothetical protein